MFRGLLRNVAISALAYSAVSGVALLLAPLLIATYGLAGFGQIVIARLFVPNAALGILDFGTGEIATQVVARARREENWANCLNVLHLLGVVAIGTGLVSGLAVAALSPFLPQWMSVAPSRQAGLTWVLLITAFVLPLLFLSLVLEGILKGFESFKALRTCEVMAAIGYGSLAVACVATGRGVDAVCYALLLSLLARFGLAAWLALRLLPKGARPSSRWSWSKETRGFVFGWTRTMAYNKTLGALQTQAAPPLIGFMFGPAAVGAVDALSRLPRFAKSVLSLLNSTVLPVAARLEGSSEHNDMTRLGRVGMLLIAIASVPPLAAAMFFSEPLTRLWLGRELASHWIWQSILFLVPLTNTLVGYGGAILLVRRHATSAMNRIVTAQVMIQLAGGLAFTFWLGAWGFILGQAIAVTLTFFFQMGLIGRELYFDRATYWSLAKLTLVAALLAPAALYIAPHITNWFTLLTALAGWTISCALLGALVILRPAQSTLIARKVLSKLPLPRPHDHLSRD